MTVIALKLNDDLLILAIFVSVLQDTVVSLQALAAYSSFATNPPSTYSVNFNIYSGAFHDSHSITSSTTDVLHELQVFSFLCWSPALTKRGLMYLSDTLHQATHHLNMGPNSRVTLW